MPTTKKAPYDGKVMDVSSPGKTAATATSKPVIITNRPLMQDPMVVADKPEEEAATPENMAPSKKTSVRIKLQPLSEADLAKQAEPTAEDDKKDESTVPEAETLSAEPAPAAQPEPEQEPEPEVPAETPEETSPEETPAEADNSDKGPKNEDPAAKAAEEAAAHDVEIQKLAESRKYYLRIDTVEKKRNRRAVALGVLMSLVLIAAWVDIALDAGLVHIGGVKAVTHFFS